MSELDSAVTAHVRESHADVISAVDRCADAVAASWDGRRATAREEVSDPLRAALREAGVLDRLPHVLADVVGAIGHEIPASPVAAPPYVVVTSRGPMLRATIEPGRLVVRLDAFDVRPEPGARYERLDGVEVVVDLE
ncbi:hypothetical protein [Halovivax sp.]|uniref:hypothetical protein n=1 Tax=Halovivax sp. TaxID=1935978 RepID=UPI0025BF62A5|nr:hypothetical protein [Halovivax sp.]